MNTECYFITHYILLIKSIKFYQETIEKFILYEKFLMPLLYILYSPNKILARNIEKFIFTKYF